MKTTQAAQRECTPGVRSRRSRPAPSHREGRLGSTLWRSLWRELVFPTFFALGGVTFLVLAADLIGYVDLAMNRGFGSEDVAWLALYRSVPMLGRAIPFAVLIGTLVALGRLGADHEIMALEASGVSARALAGPVTAFALSFAVLGTALALVAIPWSHRSLEAAVRDAGSGDSGTLLRSGQVQRLGDWRLVAREVSPRGDRLRAVAVHAPSVGGTVFAERAAWIREPDGTHVLAIESGVVMTTVGSDPTQVRFERMRQVLPKPTRGRESPGGWSAAASVGQLRAAIAADEPLPRRREALQEWHQRLALPVGTVVFAWLALALSLVRIRPSRSSGAMLAIGAAVAYYGLLQLGNGLARAEAFPIPVAVWLPNVVLGLVAAVLLATLQRWRGAAWRFSWRGSRARGHEPPRSRARIRSFVLDRYLLKTFGELLLLCFAALLAAYFVIDLLDNLKWFTKYDSSPDEILRFYGARLPLLASRVVPMALLVASALTLSLLGATGELLGMRACGVATSRIVAPVLMLCIVVAVVYHPLANDLVPRANARASRIKHTEIKGKGSIQVAVWSLSGDRLLEAERIDPMAGTATGVVLYELGSDGLPRFRTQAPRALHVGGGNWSLVEPARYEIGAGGIRAIAAEPIVQLGEGSVVEVEGEHLSIAALRREIQVLADRGLDPTAFRVDLALKLASPLACLLLPALALLFAAGGPPFPTPVHTLVASAVAGGGWVLLAAVGASLGYGGAVSPWVAGFGPVAVLGGVAVLLATRVRGIGREA
ncbi:MAG: LptF/LptG family permease [Myxococcota bacterium]|nr:LptF/LptG family permease [Myxococcota bacterium]